MKVPMTITVLVTGLVVVAATGAIASTGSGGPAGDRSTRPITVDDPPGPASALPDTAHQAALAQQPADATVTLLTGDRIRVSTTPDGRQSATPIAPAGGDGTETERGYFGFTWNGDRYVVPNSTVPYLSGTIDLRVFDVSYLVRARLDDAHTHTLPVSIRGSGAADLPAVHVTGQSGGTATATVDKAKAGRFGDLLTEQWRASATGRSSTATGRLPGVERISLDPGADAPALPAAPPRSSTLVSPQSTQGGKGLPFHTVTIDTIDVNGAPGYSVGILHNVDDGRLGTFFMDLPGQHGPVSFSVPEGTYSLEVSVMTGSAFDKTVESALVVKPELAVTSDLTVVADARTAVEYDPGLDQPVDGEYLLEVLTFDREASTGGGFKVQAFGFDGASLTAALHLGREPTDGWTQPLRATPTAPVTKGAFHFAALTEFAAAAAGGPDPRYYLVFPDDTRIPSSLTYRVPRSELTAVHSSVYRVPCTGCDRELSLFPMVYLPWSQNELAGASPVPAGERTDYWYSSAPELTTWQNAFNANDGTRLWGQRRTVGPGQRIDEVWRRGPLAPAAFAPYTQVAVAGINGIDNQVTDPSQRVCAACRQDDNAVFNLSLGDSDPSHFADYQDQARALVGSTIRFLRNGTLVFTDSLGPFDHLPTGLPLPMLPEAATYRLEWVQQRWSDPAATTTTAWTFHSARTDATPPPSDMVCTPDPARSCSLLPMLFVRFDLGLDFAGTAPAGRQFPIAFTVTGQQGAPAPSGLSATVSASFDDGETWTPAQDAQPGTGGTFTTTITHPDLAATSGFVSLHVQVRDGAGNAVDETVIRAYGLNGQ
jgi:hypothetical protein